MRRRSGNGSSPATKPSGRVKRIDIARQTLGELSAFELLPELEKKRKIRELNRKLRKRQGQRAPSDRSISAQVDRIRQSQTLDRLDALEISRPKASAMSVRQALHSCFYEIGGDRTFAKWAWSNKGDFYKLWSRMLPIEVAGDPSKPIMVEHSSNEVARRIAFVLMKGLQQKLDPGQVIEHQPPELELEKQT